MRVSEVLAGLEGVDPESDVRVWADGMRLLTTKYGHVGDATDRLYPPARVLRERFEPEEEPEVTTSVLAEYGHRRYVSVKPKWKLPEATLMQTSSGRHGTSLVVHWFDHDESTIVFPVEVDGTLGQPYWMLRSWCGQRYSSQEGILPTMPENHRMCLTCERKFDEWHTACEACGTITHNDEMHSLGGDVEPWGAVPPECESCFRSREAAEAPYRTVMGAIA